MSFGAAFKWFFKVLKEGEPDLSPKALPVFAASGEQAVQMLALLQREGRLLDFLQEDIRSFSDAEVGAAVRDIHAGCRKLLTERVKLVPVLDAAEGAKTTVPAGFDPIAITVSGNVAGSPPFTGTVRHRGWRVASLNMPTVPPNADPMIAAPAEVEV